MDQQFSSPNSADPTATLRDYTRAKLAVAALVREGWDLVRRRTGTEVSAEAEARQAHDDWQGLLVRLAEDRFNLAVVGQFKRGKSTLINAVLGRELLPTGLLPLTSAITSLCYGPVERVRLRRAGWSLEEEVPLARLVDFITERGNPGNGKGLIEARVELPLPFLRRGLYFIDTPGIGSARHENTATTYGFLPQMDAVIFVTSAEAPLSEAEAGFLADIQEHVRQRQVFVAVNKMDLINGAETDTERDEVLAYIRAQVARALAAEKPEDIALYPLSARNGLQAKLHHDVSGVEASGISIFEQALATFLATDQGRTFLVSILDRALQLLPEVSAAAGPACDGEPESPERAEAGTLQQRMESLRVRLLGAAAIGGVSLTIEADEDEDDSPAGSVVVSRSDLTGPAVMDQAVAGAAAAAMPAAMPTTSAPAEHPAGMPQGSGATQQRRSRSAGGTCPICAAQAEALFAFFAQWQQTLATSPDAQRAFVAAGGFCPAHTWQYQGMASPLGISEGYAPLIEALAAALSDALAYSPEEAGAQQITAFGADRAACPACRVLRAVEQQQADALLARLATPEGRERYARSPASASLCLPHLRAALAQITPRLQAEAEAAGPSEGQDITAFLLREQIRRLEELGEDLRSYALKRDALRRGLTNHDEETAWRRALVQLASERAVSGEASAASEPS